MKYSSINPILKYMSNTNLTNCLQCNNTSYRKSNALTTNNVLKESKPLLDEIFRSIEFFQLIPFLLSTNVPDCHREVSSARMECDELNEARQISERHTGKHFQPAIEFNERFRQIEAIQLTHQTGK
ncbi:hypothetical protein TNCT_391841 [Trichonephila clavata]|uniref:Uncharacterized protein n=1 Tax=Trichonephila clavata TaxID=2740835 RepID=A0A8X6M566_TRICU|nr:hypothetical protein TNCT_391841 [Trichonephila clavata]